MDGDSEPSSTSGMTADTLTSYSSGHSSEEYLDAARATRDIYKRAFLGAAAEVNATFVQEGAQLHVDVLFEWTPHPFKRCMR